MSCNFWPEVLMKDVIYKFRRRYSSNNSESKAPLRWPTFSSTCFSFFSFYNLQLLIFLFLDMGARFGDDFQRKRQMLYRKGEEHMYELLLIAIYFY